MKEKLSNRSRARQRQSSGAHLAARGTPESEVCVALQRLRHGHVEAEQHWYTETSSVKKAVRQVRNRGEMEEP